MIQKHTFDKQPFLNSVMICLRFGEISVNLSNWSHRSNKSSLHFILSIKQSKIILLAVGELGQFKIVHIWSSLNLSCSFCKDWWKSLGRHFRISWYFDFSKLKSNTTKYILICETNKVKPAEDVMDCGNLHSLGTFAVSALTAVAVCDVNSK